MAGEEESDLVATLREEIGKLAAGTAAPIPQRAPREKMPDTTNALNGQYRALETRVEDLRGSYHELRSDMDNRFTTLSSEIAKSADNTNARLDRVLERMESGKSNGNGGDVTRYGSIIGVLVAVAVSVIGGFVTLENNSINTSITSLASNVDKNFGRVEGSVTDLRNATVSRNELDYRINGNRDAIKSTADTQTTHSQQIASLIADARNLHDDVERMKGEIVTRRENEGHWDDFQNRLNLISTRINDLAKSTGGGELADQVRELRGQFQSLQNRFIVGPTDLTPPSSK